MKEFFRMLKPEEVNWFIVAIGLAIAMIIIACGWYRYLTHPAEFKDESEYTRCLKLTLSVGSIADADVMCRHLRDKSQNQ